MLLEQEQLREEKKPIFLDNVHEYDLHVSSDTYTLYYSEGNQWSFGTQGQIALQIRDTGNEFKILGKSPVNRGKIDYDDMLYFNILTRIIFMDRTVELAEKINL